MKKPSSTARSRRFEAAAKDSSAAKKIANWVINNVSALLNEHHIGINDCPVTSSKLSALVDLVESGELSNNQAKEVFAALFDAPDAEPDALARELGFEPAESGEIEAFVDEVITANPGKVAEIKAGNDKLINWLTGQVMKASKGKANARQVGDLLRSKIN